MRGSTRIARLLAITSALTVVGVIAPAAPAGATAPAVVRVDLRAIDFGIVLVGNNSPVTVATLTNEGSVAATGLSVGTPSSPEFVRTATTCGSTLAAGATCTVSLRYSPTVVDQLESEMVFSTAGGSKGRITLFGRSTADNLDFKVSATSFDYGKVAVGSTSPIQQVVITNKAGGTRSFTFSGRTPSGPFSSPSTSCTGSPVTLAAGASCTIAYWFQPTATGVATGKAPLVITETGLGGVPYPVELLGWGGTSGGPTMKVTPRTFDFGRVPLGSSSTANETLTFTNISGATRTFHFAGGGVNDYHGGTPDTCDNDEVLAAGASCQWSYTPEPSIPGPIASRTGISVTADGYPTQHVDVLLRTTGIGTAPVPTMSPTDLDLGPAAVGATTATRTLTVRNLGNGPMTGMTLVRSPAGDTTMEITGNTCPSTLNAGLNCFITLRYHPTATQPKFVQFRMDSNGPSVYANVRGGPHLPVHRAFVVKARADFLGLATDRDTASADELALDAGTATRRQVVTAMAGSPEWVRAIVQRLYNDTLGRDGDSGGVNFWVNQIRSGRRTVAQVAAEFYASNEYFTGVGGGTVESWVRDLYVKLLGRNADSGGLAYWVGQTTAHGRVNVASRFYQSAESRRTRVERLYRTLLLREPDAGGRDYWAGRILDEGDIALAIELASSSEYLRLATMLDGILG